MKKFIADDDREISGLEINLTPLIDVVFILLIFFMVSSSFEKKSTIPIQRPQAASAEQLSNNQQSILIAINAQGELFLEGHAIALDQVQRAVAHRLVQSAELSVLIDADQSISTGKLIQLIDQVRLAGIADIAILSQDRGQ